MYRGTGPSLARHEPASAVGWRHACSNARTHRLPGRAARAAGDLGWATLRSRGVNYKGVLAGLGALGLRPPIAPMTGPDAEARLRGIALLREAIAAAQK